MRIKYLNMCFKARSDLLKLESQLSFKSKKFSRKKTIFGKIVVPTLTELMNYIGVFNDDEGVVIKAHQGQKVEVTILKSKINGEGNVFSGNTIEEAILKVIMSLGCKKIWVGSDWEG